MKVFQILPNISNLFVFVQGRVYRGECVYPPWTVNTIGMSCRYYTFRYYYFILGIGR